MAVTRKIFILVLVGVAGFATPKFSDAGLSGYDILKNCELFLDEKLRESHIDFYEAGVCVGHIQGVAGMVEIFKTSCIPDGVVFEQLIRIGIKRLEANPDKLHMGASVEIAVAISEAFPCGEKKN